MIEPGEYNFTVYQGATWDRTFTVTIDTTPLNLTGYTAALMVKQYENSTAALTLSSGAGITLGGTAGTIAITMTPQQTATLTPGRYVYDLTVSTSGDAVRYRILDGKITVNGQVTTT